MTFILANSQMHGTCGGNVLYGFPYDNSQYTEADRKAWVKNQKVLIGNSTVPYWFATINCQQALMEPHLLELGFREVSEGWRFNYSHKIKVFLWENPKSPEREKRFVKSQEEAKARVAEVMKISEGVAERRRARLNSVR